MSGIGGNPLRITSVQPVVFFDLDDTLYRSDSGVMEAISRRITDFVILHFGKSEAEAERLRVHWRELYGTALRGMREEGYAFDGRYFALSTTFRLTSSRQPQSTRGDLGIAGPQTSADHADAVSRLAGVVAAGSARVFKGVIDIKLMGFVNKRKSPIAFRSWSA
jgi:putative hydrolase of the HAD superfamily